MALQFINLDLLSAQGIKANFLAPSNGCPKSCWARASVAIMALQFIDLDLLSAQGIKANFLAPMDGERVVGRAQV